MTQAQAQTQTIKAKLLIIKGFPIAYLSFSKFIPSLKREKGRKMRDTIIDYIKRNFGFEAREIIYCNEKVFKMNYRNFLRRFSFNEIIEKEIVLDVSKL